jgi:hypothetical protein
MIPAVQAPNDATRERRPSSIVTRQIIVSFFSCVTVQLGVGEVHTWVLILYDSKTCSVAMNVWLQLTVTRILG